MLSASLDIGGVMEATFGNSAVNSLHRNCIKTVSRISLHTIALPTGSWTVRSIPVAYLRDAPTQLRNHGFACNLYAVRNVGVTLLY